MRKILLTCGLLVTTLHFTNAQCTPDPGITEPGIYPDTIQNLPPAFESAAYSSSLQIRVLTDTTVTQGNVVVSNITVNSVVGLPSGFSYSCNPANCAFPGGGNGCVSVSGNPAVGSAGTYNIVVNATLNGLLFGFIPVSQPFTKTGYKIVIHPKPTPNFSASPTTVCVGSPVVFQDLSSDLPSSWNWTFTGASPATSTLQNPTVTYAAAGIYSVSLTASNPAGGNTLTQSGYITVKGLPASKITLTGNDTICAGDTAKMSANSGTGFSYQWRLGPNIIPGATSQNYNTTANGTYRVIVTNANGCSRTSAPVKIVKSIVAASVTPAGPLTVCPPATVTLNANTGTGLTYQWKKNGNNITGATAANYTTNKAGSYKVQVTNSAGCTKVSNTVQVTVLCRQGNDLETDNQHSIYPNPADDLTYIDLSLDSRQQVAVVVYDITGRVVTQTENELYAQGDHTIKVNTASLNNGIYFVEVTTGNEKQVLKLSVKH